MARELSQEELLDFLCQAGGRVTNAALLGHFKRFLRDPGPAGQVQQRREEFKSLVNSVATVKQEAGGGPKYVVLRKRYRDLLGEQLGPPAAEPPPGPGRCQGQGLAGASPGQEAAPPAAQPGSGAGSPGSGARCGLQEQPRPAPPGRLPRDHPRSCPGAAGRGAPGLPQADSGRQGAEPPPAAAWAGGGQGHPPERCAQSPELRRAAPHALPGAPRAHGPCAPAALQQQRTQEWVERSRGAGQVAPDSCSAPRSPGGTCPAPAPPTPEAGWRCPPPIFRSIRCQLALQDLEDFVEQASPGSEEGGGGGTGSEGSDSPLEAGDTGASPAGGAGEGPRDPGALDSRCQQLSNGAPSDRYLRSQRPANRQVVEVNGTVPCTRRSFRSKSTYGSSRVSSSEDELRDQDQGRRSRRPRRSRKMAKGAILASPGVDTPITFQYLGSEQRQTCVPTEEVLPVPHSPLDPRPSSVPLHPREHNWIVTVAAGSWVQVRALFLEEPQLALQRDFISGYTALHWIAKHGANQVLQDLVSGAKKAGTPLDVNVKSSCGYTPLHLAAIHGHQRIMKLLVQELNSKVNVRDSSGKRPWQYLSSSTSGEMWQLLGAPKGKTIFPTQPLVRPSSPPRKAKSQEVARSISRKTSLVACLKPKHMKWKMATKYPALREREEYSD
ncbi:ankyrin repeat domain-containing protein SOWAHB [Trachemys scripta elegans]|uniref:ankyrin repeat domain-containing protein SOWAHB n=1 Tax=Trachemys scripta elegans TaxID=31138 RepID=UPI001557E6DE|nr:ankyrin repeat domain-containing protein SOWAHB [Trachemys scripta elegans]